VKQKMLTLIEDAKAMPTPALPEFEPLEHVHAAAVLLESRSAGDVPEDARGYFRMWHHHFEFLLLAMVPT